jgi:hypothetical protein
MIEGQGVMERILLLSVEGQPIKAVLAHIYCNKFAGSIHNGSLLH